MEEECVLNKQLSGLNTPTITPTDNCTRIFETTTDNRSVGDSSDVYCSNDHCLNDNNTSDEVNRVIRMSTSDSASICDEK